MPPAPTRVLVFSRTLSSVFSVAWQERMKEVFP